MRATLRPGGRPPTGAAPGCGRCPASGRPLPAIPRGPAGRTCGPRCRPPSFRAAAAGPASSRRRRPPPPSSSPAPARPDMTDRTETSTAAGRPPASAAHSSTVRRMAGWVRASSSASCRVSANTIRPSTARLIRPSAAASGQRADTRSAIGWPGASRPRPTRSASRVSKPRSASIPTASDLPAPMPPPTTARTGPGGGSAGRIGPADTTRPEVQRRPIPRSLSSWRIASSEESTSKELWLSSSSLSGCPNSETAGARRRRRGPCWSNFRTP